MGMRWVVIPEPSRRVIEQLVTEHEAEGGQAFDPDHLPEGEPVSGATALDAEPTVVRSFPEADREQPRPTAAVEGRLRIRPDASPPSQPPHDLARGGGEEEPHGSGLEDSVPAEPPRATGEARPAATEWPRKDAGPTAPAEGGAGSRQGPPQHVVAAPAPPDIVMPNGDDGVAGEAPRRRATWPWLAAVVVVLAGAAITVRILGWPPGAGSVRQPTPRENLPRPTALEPRAESLPTAATVSDAARRGPGEPGVEPGDTSAVTSQEIPSELPTPMAPAAEPAVGDTGTEVAPRGVRGITWSHETGSTEVEIRLGSKLSPKDVSVSQFEQPPRILIRIPDVSEPFSPLLIPVGSPELAQVRSWLHVERRPPELHVVLDLAGDRASLTEVRREAHAIVLVIGGGVPGGGPS